MNTIKTLLRTAIRFGFWCLIELVYLTYKAEGLNALFLFMPAALIVPTLRKYGATIGENVQMHTPLIIHNASSEWGKHYTNLTISDNCYLGRDVFLDLADNIYLAPYVTVSMRCTLITHTNVGEKPQELINLPTSYAPIRLELGSYLGAGCTILEGVTIGKSAVVGAGAVVTTDVTSATTVVGVPARPFSRV